MFVEDYLFLFISLIILSLLFSALSLFNDIPAHIAAGSQPINVICKMKHKIAEKIFPLTRNEIQGNKIASSMF